jgi:hypothetical protein
MALWAIVILILRMPTALKGAAMMLLPHWKVYMLGAGWHLSKMRCPLMDKPGYNGFILTAMVGLLEGGMP